MIKAGNTWGLILAGGEGSRLRSLTTLPSGDSIPKQFCSLHGDRTLVQAAIDRAAGVVPLQRVCLVVAQRHKRWWQGLLQSVAAENLFVQPSNKGTAIGILYPLLHILARDPQARVVLLPADHFVVHEAILRHRLHDVIRTLDVDGTPVLVGVTPEEPDPEFGYVVPGTATVHDRARVLEFIEKPEPHMARRIIERGGLWNTFILVASARRLLELFSPRYDSIASEMQAVLEHLRWHCDPLQLPNAIVELYQRLPSVDFSHDVLQGHEAELHLACVHGCGWSDLGTPERVAETLQRLAPAWPATERRSDTTFLSLAAQHAKLRNAVPAAR